MAQYLRRSGRSAPLCIIVAALQFAASAVFSVQVIYQDGQPDPFLGGTYTGVDDVWLYNNGGGYFNSATDNTGTDPRMDVGIPYIAGYPDNAEWIRRQLVRFPILSMSGQYLSITSVTIELTLLNSPQGAGFLNAHRVSDANASWLEGVGENGSSWAYRINQTSTPWAGGGGIGQSTGGAGVAGTDYFAGPLGSVAFNSGMTAGSTLSITFNDVSFIGNWVSGSNAGILLKTGSDAIGSRTMFHSSESGTASARPKLIIDYVPVPEPAVFALGVSGAAALFFRRRQKGG